MVYWIWLTTRPHCNAAFCGQLLDAFGTPEAIWKANIEQLRELECVSQARLESLMDKDLTGANHILADCEKRSIRLVTIQSNEYPVLLQKIKGCPLLLYVRGHLPDFRQKLAIAIVGTRKATDYGLAAARHFAGNLAQNGCIIVSGMALGIDAAANQAALDAGGSTVAVLGCGVDICYPWQNEALMQRLIARGAVVSEYPPGTSPAGWRFPQRNRIMTGMCQGTLVIEAPRKSGALISADHALEQGRDVFAVPGNINRPNSEGCNVRIREGSAMLAQSPMELLAYYKKQPDKQTKYRQTSPPHVSKTSKIPNTPNTAETPNTASEKPKRRLEGNALEREVWQAVAAAHAEVDAIVEVTGYTAAQVLSALTMLEIGAYIIHSEDGYHPAEDVIA